MEEVGEIDTPTQFAGACQRSAQYPLTLLRTEVFGHVQRSLQTRLGQERVFHDSYQAFFVRDVQENSLAFDKGQKLENVDEVEAHVVGVDTNDPWWRFIFIFSKDSRSALGCSKEQLSMLLTYHQVMPSFLDLVFTFQDRREKPLNYALFRHENYLDVTSPSLSLPHLGRSGIQVQHAFNLLTVERADAVWEHNQWPLRHASLYHSLDLKTGRAVYIVMKGNAELAARIKTATDTNRHLRPDTPRTSEQSFLASLQVHLIMLEWSVESWGKYIDSMDDRLQDKSIEARIAPVAKVASPVNLAQRLGSEIPLVKQGGATAMVDTAMVDEPHSLIDQLDDLENRFSFDQLQRLGLMGDELGQSILALEQSRAVVSQVQEQYETVIASHAFNTFVNQEKCNGDVAAFFRRLRSVLQDMDVHHRRLQALARTVEVDKQLFQSLIQHTSMQTSKAFQLVAQTSSHEMMQWTHRMHEIAIKTKQETLSMHVITVFTLIFLPGTFVATLFSSGVLRWDEDGTLGDDWVVRGGGVRLFLSVCLPLTVITVSIWGIMYAAARRGARRHGKELGLPQYAAEKGGAVVAGSSIHREGRRVSAKLFRGRSQENIEWNQSDLLHSSVRDAFVEFVDTTKANHIGHDLAREARPYVPLSALREYWTASNVASVLRSFPVHPDIEVGIIRRSYLRIFSTLVYADLELVRSLPDLFVSRGITDSRLPWNRQPSEWPDAPIFNNFFKRIAKSQWQFYPFDFHPDQLYNRILSDEWILPINFTTTINQGAAASVYSFDINPEYNHFTPRDEQGQPAHNTFVFKTYHNKHQEQTYTNEGRALRRLRSTPSPYVVQFYGSLQQRGSYSLILEYVDGGNIAQLFATAPPPPTAEDAVLFWQSLFQVFAGLDRIHQLMLYDDDPFKGIHEDIRPENILVEKGPSGSPYEFTPKIADFGLYSRVKTATGGSGVGLDHYGNQRFSSPECCHHTISRYGGINMVTPASDIFSMGAVLSHTVAWLVGGRKEQDLYFKTRKAHHDKNLRRFKGSGYEGCFHNSLEPLPLVAEHHQNYRARLDPSDDVTPKVLEWINKCMFVPANDRRSARDILEMFEQFMDSRLGSSPPSPMADLAVLQLLRGRVPVPSSPSEVSITEIETQLGIPADPQTAALVDYLEQNLSGSDGDQFFFIDDSSTMASHRATITSGFRALASIAKRLDPNQVELAFASRPGRVYRARRTRRLLDAVAECEYKGDGRMMEKNLAELVDGAIIPGLPYKVLGVNVNVRARKKVSLYVFTDGEWGDGAECGVEGPVRRIIEVLKRRGLDRTEVRLHFVRFGEGRGSKCLERLDELGKEEGWDIVDIKHITGPVVGMMIGPLSRDNDDKAG
ncbi:hypothetical protein C8A05DRAFT_42815 [Staphylotrichum tortipilum]|uniref:Protein kinase domain-containing protein n=1 Tax=Staphylotrichum tortipilum TaxID=2831512 RepID=A0AAN6RVA1_9PEZI|nr:hypothetical protein C8A05DRAFT_42815 [Staphylotrichum longicolle]